jgi:uncharacterized membrane protein YfcA
MDITLLILLLITAILSFILSWIGASVGLVIGHLRLPLIIYMLDSPILGALSNLIISGFGALGGSLEHLKKNRVSFQLVILIGLPSVIGCVLGSWFLLNIPSFWGYLIIGGMLIYSGINLSSNKKENIRQLNSPPALIVFVELVAGLLLGFLSAVTGLMQNSLRLPLIIKVLKVDPKIAIGSTMVIGCITAFSGAIVSWSLIPHKTYLGFYITLFIIPFTFLGSYWGAKMTNKFSSEQLVFIIGPLIISMGCLMIIQGVYYFFNV